MVPLLLVDATIVTSIKMMHGLNLVLLVMTMTTVLLPLVQSKVTCNEKIL